MADHTMVTLFIVVEGAVTDSHARPYNDVILFVVVEGDVTDSHARPHNCDMLLLVVAGAVKDNDARPHNIDWLLPELSKITMPDHTVVTYCCWLLQELSKITMPVIFNEPLSFLQRIAEYMEYTSLVECAAASDDPVERLEVHQSLICLHQSQHAPTLLN